MSLINVLSSILLLHNAKDRLQGRIQGGFWVSVTPPPPHRIYPKCLVFQNVLLPLLQDCRPVTQPLCLSLDTALD